MENRSAKERDWSSAGKHISSNQDNVERRMKIIEPYIKNIVFLVCQMILD